MFQKFFCLPEIIGEKNSLVIDTEKSAIQLKRRQLWVKRKEFLLLQGYSTMHTLHTQGYNQKKYNEHILQYKYSAFHAELMLD